MDAKSVMKAMSCQEYIGKVRIKHERSPASRWVGLYCKAARVHLRYPRAALATESRMARLRPKGSLSLTRMLPKTILKILPKHESCVMLLLPNRKDLAAPKRIPRNRLFSQLYELLNNLPYFLLPIPFLRRG